MKTIKIILFVYSFFTLGCAQSVYFSPSIKQQDNQELFLVEGKEVVISKLEQTEVMLYATRDKRSELVLSMLYANLSESPINVYPENVKVTGLTIHGGLCELKVYSAGEYVKNIKPDQRFEEILMALEEFSNALNAGKSTTTTSGTIGSETVDLHTETYDYNKQSELNQRNAENRKNMIERHSATVETINSSLLKSNTLFPDSYIEGKVIVEYKPCMRFYIEIPFGDIIHRIELVKKYRPY